jgi:transcription termination factor Rho
VTVLQRKELEDSPLADLHAIASELGLEGFRTLRRETLIDSILESQGGEAAPDDSEPDEVPAAERLEEPETEAEPEPEAEEEAEPEAEEEAEPEAEPEDEPEQEEEPEPEPQEEPEPEEQASGVLDVLPNGSGFIRTGPDGQSRDDVYVSPAQIRRCELRAGDEIAGPVRPPRRNERHPSLIRVQTVNGGDAEPPEERPYFGELTPVFPTQRLAAPAALDSAPFGRGSRVAVSGPAGAGATTLLREIATTLAGSHPDLDVQVVLVGVRPEEVTDWRSAVSAPVTGGSFERSSEAQVQAAELAVERAKRRAERGGHAVLVIDSLEALPPGAQRRVFGAGRATEEGGSVTVIAATGDEREPLRWATTRVVLGADGSGTLHGDRLS